MHGIEMKWQNERQRKRDDRDLVQNASTVLTDRSMFRKAVMLSKRTRREVEDRQKGKT